MKSVTGDLPPQDQVPLGKLLQLDADLDIAAIEVADNADQPISCRAMNWSEARLLTTAEERQLEVRLDPLDPSSAWTLTDAESRLAECVPIACAGFGARCGVLRGEATHMAVAGKQGCVIQVDNLLCDYGDSGAAVWSVEEDGTAKVLGMLGWMTCYDTGAGRLPPGGWLVPAWTLLDKARQWGFTA